MKKLMGKRILPRTKRKRVKPFKRSRITIKEIRKAVNADKEVKV